MSSNIGAYGIDFGEYICPVCNGRRVKFAGPRGIRWICLKCQETELRHDDDFEIVLTGEYPHNLTANIRKKFVNTRYFADDIPLDDDECREGCYSFADDNMYRDWLEKNSYDPDDEVCRQAALLLMRDSC